MHASRSQLTVNYVAFQLRCIWTACKPCACVSHLNVGLPRVKEGKVVVPELVVDKMDGLHVHHQPHRQHQHQPSHYKFIHEPNKDIFTYIYS